MVVVVVLIVFVRDADGDVVEDIAVPLLLFLLIVMFCQPTSYQPGEQGSEPERERERERGRARKKK